ncbi:serpin-ZX-like [Lotus japonicus]|uniref:serpin-ZX-like n=1 Tax=Lotus japonicus TaxID=34305 RepID=UPI0025910DBD|nr:serpin-ZX-like [Lotus japonicus]
MALTIIVASGSNTTLSSSISNNIETHHCRAKASARGISPVFSDKDADADADAHHLSSTNGMFVDKSVSLSYPFRLLLAYQYKASLASLDFKNRGDRVLHDVNSLIERKSNGHITQLLPPGTITNLTRLIFANALRFQGLWKHKFDGPRYEFSFFLLNGTSVKVPFMTIKKKTHYIRAFDGFKILRLPYKQGRDRKRRFSMCIFLPDARDGLSTLIQKLSSEPGFLKGKLPRRKVRVDALEIPKFNISFTFEASNVLKEVGVVSPFSPMDACFTKMVERRFYRNNPLCWAGAQSS